jgi:hypothetical protein
MRLDRLCKPQLTAVRRSAVLVSLQEVSAADALHLATVVALRTSAPKSLADHAMGM